MSYLTNMLRGIFIKIVDGLKSNFVKGAMVLASGTVGAQVVTFLMLPIITRMYGPEEYGVYGVYYSFVSMIAPVASLSFPIAIVLQQSKQEAITIASLSIWVSLFVSLLILAGFVTLDEQLEVFLNVDLSLWAAILISATIFFISLIQVGRQLLIREGKFKKLSVITLRQSLLMNILKVSYGKLSATGDSLLAMTLAGSAINSLVVLRDWRKKVLFVFFDFKNMLEAALKNKDMAFYRTPQVLIQTASTSLPIILIASSFGTTEAAFFSLARGVLEAPVTLVGNSLGDVFFPKIVKKVNGNDKVFLVMLSATMAMVMVGLVVFVGVRLLSPFLIESIFGKEWSGALIYFKWMAVLSFSSFILVPTSKLIYALRLQKMHLIYTACTVLLSLSTTYYYALKYQLPEYAVAAYCLTTSVGFFVLTIMALYKSHSFDKCQVPEK